LSYGKKTRNKNNVKDGRPGWEEYFMQVAKVIATRSTCLRRKVGAVIVREHKILSTGYNGAPHNIKHCSETGCLRKELEIPSGERHEICRGIHAEQNAILQAALSGTSIKDAEIYSTTFPCIVCAKMIINAGIKTMIFLGDYPDDLSKEMLSQADVKVTRLKRLSQKALF